MVLEDTVAERAQALRAFSRFYTAIIGALREGLLETSYSLTEARVIFELGRQESIDVADLRTTLGLDAGYLSRIRARLEDEGLVTRGTSGDDRRRHVIGLTAKGRAEFELLDARSAEQAEAFIGRLAEDDQRSLVASFATVERLLGGSAGDGIVLREPRPGDLGWVVERHGALYAAEYGWDATFEALVAGIVAGFAARADAASERAWIAEAGGTRAGSILCTRHDETTAQLRLLLVEPAFRGHGLGRPAGRRVPGVRPLGRIRPHRPLDERRAGRRPPHLRASGVHARRGGPAHELRPRPRRPDLVAAALDGRRARDAAARLLQELPSGAGRVGGGEQLGVRERGALERGIVEERVDPAGPRRGVQVRLGVMVVARRAAVGRPAAGIAVAHVDRRVEVLGPDPHDRRVVAGLGLGAQRAPARRSRTRTSRPGPAAAARSIGERLVEVAVRRDVELLLLADIGLDPERSGRLAQRGDRVRRAVDHEPVVDDPVTWPSYSNVENPPCVDSQDDLAVHEPLRRRDDVDGEPVEVGERLGRSSQAGT